MASEVTPPCKAFATISTCKGLDRAVTRVSLTVVGVMRGHVVLILMLRQVHILEWAL